MHLGLLLYSTVRFMMSAVFDIAVTTQCAIVHGHCEGASSECSCVDVEGRRYTVLPRVTPHEQHAHHHKDEVIVRATKAIIARFFVVITP